jgi:hypothetical protein
MRIACLVLLSACWGDSAPPPARPDARPLVIQSGSRAHDVRQPGDAPSIEMAEALSLARAYALDHNVRFDHAYLQGAVFDAAARQWVFDWQVPNAKGGLTIIYVHESGAVTINYGE